MRHGSKLGPNPTRRARSIGGVIAINSSGMTCGIVRNSYRTVESLVLVPPSGTVLDTGHPDSARLLLERKPELNRDLIDLRERLRASLAASAQVRQQISIKNTMGYGLYSFLDFETPLDIQTHLAIGSEGTLVFVAEATF